MKQTLSNKIFTDESDALKIYAEDVKDFIKGIKDSLKKDLKEVLDGAIIIYTGKKKGVKYGKLINKKDIELKIIGCFISNKIKEIDKRSGEYFLKW